MKITKSLSIGVFTLGFLFVGCTTKNDITNQTALYWHNQIYTNITSMNLDLADDKFTSLEVEHPNSQFIPVDLLNLAKAHQNNGEFQLAQFYINEYEKRYANNYEKEWCEYDKVKLQFFSLKNPYTNQEKLSNTLKLTNIILNDYPNSIYNYELNTIKKKLEITQLLFDNKIANLYKRLDKPKAEKIYTRDINETIIPPTIPWYKKMFYW